jgi:hypothetical protein
VYDFADDYLEDVSFCVTDVLDAGTEGTFEVLPRLRAWISMNNDGCFCQEVCHAVAATFIWI